MKNIFPVLLFFLFSSAGASASEPVRITWITDSVRITRPDNGEATVYKDINGIPGIMYGSKILADGGPAEIKIFNLSSVSLEKDQEILVLKHPVTKAIEISKVESSEIKPKNPEIKIWLAASASAVFGSDTRVTVFERYPSVIFTVIRGLASVKAGGGKTYELKAGDYYEAKQDLTK